MTVCGPTIRRMAACGVVFLCIEARIDVQREDIERALLAALVERRETKLALPEGKRTDANSIGDT